jgi:hypothetical protein
MLYPAALLFIQAGDHAPRRAIGWGTQRKLSGAGPPACAKGKGRTPVTTQRTRSRSWPGWLVAAFAAAGCGLGGCANFWDDVTSKDFKMENLWKHPDPLWVLQNSTDGDKRARALRALQEPLPNGGTQQQQDMVVSVLVYTAANDPQALCRMASITSLRHFKDVRVAKALEDAYYRAGSFNPDVATVIRCQALQAMGELQGEAAKSPEVVDTLVKALREPPVEGPDTDRQQKLDERIAAARALGHYKHYQATSALTEVLRSEKDVALRTCAVASLRRATGKDLPADPQAWDDFLRNAGPNDRVIVRQPTLKDKALEHIGWWFADE